MSLVQYGLNMHFGLGATTVTVTGVTGLFQGIDYERTIDEIETTDQRNNTVAWTATNNKEQVTFTYVATDAQSPSGSAVITYPLETSRFSVTADSAVSGTLWICKSVSVQQTKDKNTEVTIKATRYPGITS